LIEPKITTLTDGYHMIWEDIKLQIKVKRVNLHSDGHVTGDIEITNSSVENPVILMPSSQFNFSAERTRSQTAKSLKEKYNDESVNWVEIFDYLGYKIQDLARKGEEVYEVIAEDDAPSPARILDPVIYQGVQNIIFGEKGVNKSTLTYLFAYCISLPWFDNPLELILQNDKDFYPTLILDWETDQSIFKYYLSRLKKGMNLPPCPIYYRRCYLPLIQDIEPVQDYITNNKIKVIIIDSLGAAAGGESGELKGSQAALAFNSSLRKLKTIENKPITSLIIGQTAKGSDDSNNKKTVFGSTYFTYYARNIFELCHGKDDNEDLMHLGLFHRECNLGKKHQPMGFCVTYNDQERSIQVEREPVSVREFAERVGTQALILDLLKRAGEPLTLREIMDDLEITRNNADVTLSRLKRKGKILKLNDKWGLVYNG